MAIRESHTDTLESSGGVGRTEIEFDNLNEAVEFSASDRPQWNTCSGKDYQRYEWAFGLGLPETVKLAATGWTEGVAQARKLANGSEGLENLRTQQPTVTFTMDIAGGCPIVPVALSKNRFLVLLLRMGPALDNMFFCVIILPLPFSGLSSES